MFAAVNDPRRPLVAPKPETVPPALNFAPLENAATALTRSGGALQEGGGRRASDGRGAPGGRQRVNARLIQSERQLLDPAGLPNRPWFRHLLYAPASTPATA